MWKIPKLINTLRFSYEMQDFCEYIRDVFERKIDPTFDPVVGRTAFMPVCAASNPAVRQQYINGHFCYAQKAAVISNGLSIARHIGFLDDDFKMSHPEMRIDKRTNHPEVDKEAGDSTSLKPVLLDFKAAHPTFRYRIFSADSAFDSYDNFAFLLNDYGFQKAIVPLNDHKLARRPRELIA